MNVRFRLNLGSNDGRELGLNPKDCREGDVAEVEDSVAAALIRRHIAEELPEIKAVPPEPIKGVKSKAKDE